MELGDLVNVLDAFYKMQIALSDIKLAELIQHCLPLMSEEGLNYLEVSQVLRMYRGLSVVNEEALD